MLRSYLAIGVLILVPSLGHGQTLSSQRCERLASLTLPNTAIAMAEVNTSSTFIPSGVTTSPNANLTNLPPFCRVAATLRPSSGSDIRIEVWMSLANWNSKFQGVGNGGFAGSITYTSGNGGIERGMAEALKRGYATASTDTGHTADAVPAFLGHPEKLVDFGYRAVHEMTVAAKAIIDAFYGTDPRLSYWNGCSTGGRQGLMEAQRLSRRLRRHHRRCSGKPSDAARCMEHVRRAGGSKESGKYDSFLEVPDDPSGGAERLRCPRRIGGWPDCRTEPMQLRFQDTRMSEARTPRLALLPHRLRRPGK